MMDADIVISSTGCSGYVVSERYDDKYGENAERPSAIFSRYCCARDLDPAIAEMENAFLYDIDDLRRNCSGEYGGTKNSAEKIMLMIEEELSAFHDWVNMLGVVPVIAALREKATAFKEKQCKVSNKNYRIYPIGKEKF